MDCLGNPIVYKDIIVWETKDEALNNRLRGETVRRVRIVEVMRRELSSE